MLLLIFVILGVFAALLNKGKLSGLAGLKGMHLPIAALVVSSIPGFFPGIAYMLKAVLLSFSYYCILAFAVLNRRFLLPSLLTGIGTLSNFIVIAANKFRMPVSEYALVYYPELTPEAVLAAHGDYFIAVNNEANLMILADVICIPIPHIGGFISVGDVFLAVGVSLLIFAAMSSAKPKNALFFSWQPPSIKRLF